jgi:hypothetical protein
LIFKILKDDLTVVLKRSVVRSAADSAHRNKRITFNSDVQETLEKLDTIPGAAILSDNPPKQISRKPNDEISNRTRSKNIGDRARSTVQFRHNSSLQGNFFSLYNAIKFKDKRKVNDVNLQLG